jgi:undecaprenyl-diphosphatase
VARDRTELTLLLSALFGALLLVGFFFLAAEVVEGDTQAFDVRILEALRHPDHPEIPIGPQWLTSAALDITALGSSTVLGLVTVTISGFLLLQGMKRTAAFVFIATVSGWALNDGMKLLFERARPDVVPHLRDVMSASFPSGHAMTAAVVYLTLGALTMRLADRRVTKFYCIAVAMILTLLVGASRVFLGVHYPTDVLAGWLLGLLWALVCWTTERRLERGAGLRREQRELQAR